MPEGTAQSTFDLLYTEIIASKALDTMSPPKWDGAVSRDVMIWKPWCVHFRGLHMK